MLLNYDKDEVKGLGVQGLGFEALQGFPCKVSSFGFRVRDSKGAKFNTLAYMFQIPESQRKATEERGKVPV